MWFVIVFILSLPVLILFIHGMNNLSRLDKDMEEFKQVMDDFDKGMEKYVEWLERNTKNGRH